MVMVFFSGSSKENVSVPKEKPADVHTLDTISIVGPPEENEEKTNSEISEERWPAWSLPPGMFFFLCFVTRYKCDFVFHGLGSKSIQEGRRGIE